VDDSISRPIKSYDRYYRRFIRGYGAIVAPLTKLPLKGGFQWSATAEEAFCTLQRAPMTAPVLQLLTFDKEFIVECDTSGFDFGAVLHQGNDVVVFFSQPIMMRHTKLAAYERELIKLVQVVCHWCPYLWGCTFIVRTDHYNLKFLVDQWLSTILQHRSNEHGVRNLAPVL
jgi:hypothetical protein